MAKLGFVECIGTQQEEKGVNVANWVSWTPSPSWSRKWEEPRMGGSAGQGEEALSPALTELSASRGQWGATEGGEVRERHVQTSLEDGPGGGGVASQEWTCGVQEGVSWKFVALDCETAESPRPVAAPSG